MAKRKKGFLAWVKSMQTWNLRRIEKSNKRARDRKNLRERKAKAQFERAGRQMEKKSVLTGAQVRQADAEHEWDWAIPTRGASQPATRRQSVVHTGPAPGSHPDSYTTSDGTPRCPGCGGVMKPRKEGGFRCPNYCMITATQETSTSNPSTDWEVGGVAVTETKFRKDAGLAKTSAKTQKRSQASTPIHALCGQTTTKSKPCRQKVNEKTGQCAAGHRPKKVRRGKA